MPIAKKDVFYLFIFEWLTLVATKYMKGYKKTIRCKRRISLYFPNVRGLRLL